MNALLVCALALAADDFADGVRAYREGRYREALEAFAAAERSARGDPSVELLHNKALSALKAGNLLEAESSAEKAAARGGPELAPLRDFVLGNVAFARSEKAEEETRRPGAGPSAFDPAILHAEKARVLWQLAAAGRPDWPEARRNVERALLRLEELGRRKAEAERSAKERRPEPPRPIPRPETEREPDPEGRKELVPAPPPEPQPEEAAAVPVQRLIERLARKEMEKLALRRARQRAEGRGVERDW